MKRFKIMSGSQLDKLAAYAAKVEDDDEGKALFVALVEQARRANALAAAVTAHITNREIAGDDPDKFERAVYDRVKAALKAYLGD